MRARAFAATFLLAVALGSVSAGDAHGQSGYFPWCEPAPFHPIQVPLPVPGFVVACRNADQSSVHLRNVSPHVLRVEPLAGYANPRISQVDDGEDAPGVQAAQDGVPSGWYSDDVFRLSLGESAVVSANGLVGVTWHPDPGLTAKANAARWTAGRLHQLLEQENRPLNPATRWYRLVDSCAAAGTKAFAEGSRTIRDVLSTVMSANGCRKQIRRALGTSEQSAVKQFAGDLLHVARPVAEEQVLIRVLRQLTR